MVSSALNLFVGVFLLLVTGSNATFVTLFGTSYDSNTATEIFLTGQISKSAIPTEIGILTRLLNLDIDTNAMTGTIPTEIGLLTALINLNLATNSLTGPIPTEMGMLTALSFVRLHENSLSKPIPTELGMLNQLRELYLYYNHLDNKIPSHIGQATALTVLQLYVNCLTGTIPTTLGNLVNLSNLYLYDNSLTGGLPLQLGSLTKLAELGLQGNRLNGSIPSIIGMLTALANLNLALNTLTGSIPTQIGMLTRLSFVTLHTNSFTGPIPTELGLLSQMQQLILCNNHLGLATSLNLLQMYVNCLTGSIPITLGSIPSQIGNLIRLNVLGLSQNCLNGPLPTEIGLLTALTSLDVSSNSLADVLPSQLGLITNMKILDLHANGFSGDIPSQLGLLSTLTSLKLNQNNFVCVTYAVQALCALLSTDCSIDTLGICYVESLSSLWFPAFGHLVAYYTFDDADQGMTPEQINSYTGTISGGVSFGSAGIVGNAATFDGTGWIDVPPQVLNNLNSGTIMAWVYPADVTNGNICYKQHVGDSTHAVLSLGTSLNCQGALTTKTSGKLYWHGYNDLLDNCQTPEFVSGNSIFSTNTWYHVAVTFTTSSVSFYVNGVLDSSNSVADGYIFDDLSPSTVTRIGSTYSGKIDDFSVWDISLSVNQIALVHSIQSTYALSPLWTPSYSHLVAYFTFDDVYGTTSPIEGIHGYSGSVTGGVTFGSTGVVGNAATFDGLTGWIDIPPQVLNDLPSGTIMAWIYPADVTNNVICGKQHGGVESGSILSFGSTAICPGFHTLETPGKLYWHGFNDASLNCQSPIIVATNFNFSINTWFHVAVTFSTSSVSFYVNGILDSTIAATLAGVTNDLSPNIDFTRIGAYYPFNMFSGKLDDFSVWNKALSGGDIAQIYQIQSSRTQPPTVQPIGHPTGQPSNQPTAQPTGHPGPSRIGLRFRMATGCGADITCLGDPNAIYKYPRVPIEGLSSDFTNIHTATNNNFGLRSTYDIVEWTGYLLVPYGLGGYWHFIVGDIGLSDAVYLWLGEKSGGYTSKNADVMLSYDNYIPNSRPTFRTPFLSDGQMYPIRITNMAGNAGSNLRLIFHTPDGASFSDAYGSFYYDTEGIASALRDVTMCSIAYHLIVPALTYGWRCDSTHLPLNTSSICPGVVPGTGGGQPMLIPGWDGVTCDATGNIISIAGSGLFGGGDISPLIINLIKLTSLDLSENSLIGSIPSELGACTNLADLKLSSNTLGSAIPTQLGVLLALTSLQLEGNALSSSIPTQLGALIQLSTLNLARNLLHGAIPSELGALGSLSYLSLAANFLTGFVPFSISYIANGLTFNICMDCTTSSVNGCSTIRGVPARIFEVANPPLCSGALLTAETVAMCDLAVIIGTISGISGWQCVSVIGGYGPTMDICNWDGVSCSGGYISSINITQPAASASTIPNSINQLYRLTSLVLSHVGFTGSIPSETGLLVQLRYLDFSNNHLSSEIPSEIGLLNSLTQLVLYNNSFTGAIPYTICSIPGPFSYFCAGKTSDEGCSHLAGAPPCFGQSALIGTLPSTQDQGLCAIAAMLPIINWGCYNDVPNTPVCYWIGVTCDGSQRAIKLDFSSANIGMFLSGSIPSEIGYLISLTQISMSGNSITGRIPTQMGLLTNLVSLALDQNSLSKSIPTEIYNLTQLEALILSQNLLTGSISPLISQLANLNFLCVSSNLLSQSIPISIGALGNVFEIDISQNRLLGPIPSSVGLCSLLTKLDLHSNSLSHKIPAALAHLLQLHILNLNTNILTGSIPCQLGALTVLTTLDLSSNNLDATIPSELGRLQNLQVLSLYLNSLSWNVPTTIGALTGLTSFNVHSNRLTGEIPTQLGAMVGLSYIYINSNRIFSHIPTEIGILTNLITLSAQSNSLIGSLPTQLGLLRSITLLDLSYNYLSQPLPVEIGSMTSLQALVLTMNSIYGTIPTRFGNLANLRDALLGNCAFWSSIPSEISGLSNLRTLRLEGNFLTSIPTEMGLLTNLNYLNLGGNRLLGAIPSQLGAMQSLTYLDLRLNSLSSMIPCELGNLQQLRQLLLSSNRLTGTLPSTVYSLTVFLQLLYVDNNLLNGTVSSSLGNLKLIDLEINSNQFTGFVPNSFCALTDLRTLKLCSDCSGTSNEGCSSLSGYPDCIQNFPYLGTYCFGNLSMYSLTTFPSIQPSFQQQSQNPSVAVVGTVYFKITQILTSSGPNFRRRQHIQAQNISSPYLTFSAQVIFVATVADILSVNTTQIDLIAINPVGGYGVEIVYQVTYLYRNDLPENIATNALYLLGNETTSKLHQAAINSNDTDVINSLGSVQVAPPVILIVTQVPTGQPSGQPSHHPSIQPTGQPTTEPSCQPSSQPSGQPTGQPMGQPSGQPTTEPSCQPSSQPSGRPTRPTGQPSAQPSRQPSAQPSRQPSSQPSPQPSSQPSGQPTAMPTVKPPGLTLAVFADSGSYITFVFDEVTDQGSTSLGSMPASWSCDILFSFTGDSNCVCNWITRSAIRAVLPFYNGTFYLASPGDTITSKSGFVRKWCSTYACSTPNFASTILASYPLSPVVPAIIIIASPVNSNCNNYIIDTSACSGSGGRNWVAGLSYWGAVGVPIGSSSATAIRNLLPDPSSSTFSNEIVIPSSNLLIPGVYTFALALTNFLGQSASKVFSVTVNNDAVPSVSIVGSTNIALKSNQLLSISAQGSSAVCSSSRVVTYSWRITLNGVDLSLVSRSLDPTVYILPAYSLAPNSVYVATVMATSASGLSNAASASINVVDGGVVAKILGASTFTSPIDQLVLLYGSSSYDENSPSAPLTYAWTCSVASSGADCTSSLTVTSSTATIAPFTLQGSTHYIIQLQCNSTDGRSSQTSVTIMSILAGAPTVTTQFLTQIIRIGSVMKINANSKLTFSGTIIANTSSTSYWTATSTGASVKLSAVALTPLQLVIKSKTSGFAYPLSIAPNSLIPGVLFTFTLSAYPLSRTDLVSSASLSITVNAPPSSGVLHATPSSGVSLTDTFTFSAIGWSDDVTDYPLTYDFNYISNAQSAQLSLAKVSAIAYVASVLPPGAPITVVCGIYDNWGAQALSSAAVFVNVSAAATITTVLSTLLAASAGTASTTVSSCNVVASTYTAQNCVNAPNCTALNRYLCDSQSYPNTCGSCLQSYAGSQGSSNQLCTAEEVALTANNSCSADSQCLYQSCIAGTCVVPLKQCPGNSCSGHGNCTFTDSSGNLIQSCLVSNSYCQAVCTCANGYAGADCSLAPGAAASRDASRALMCSSILQTIGTQNPSAQLINTLANSFASIFNPFEVQSTLGISQCVLLLSNITSLCARGFLVGATSDAISSIASAISSVVTSKVLVAQYIPAFESIKTSMDDFTAGLLQDLTQGQAPLIVQSANFQMSVHYDLVTSLHNSTILFPQASSLASDASSLSLPLSGLDACSDGDSYLQLSVAQWNTNPYFNSSNMKTPLVRFSSHTSTSSNGSRSDLSNAAESFFVKIPYNTPQAFNATTKTYANSSFPYCVTRQTPVYARADCNVSSFTATSVTFKCASVAALCPSHSVTRRRLQSTTMATVADNVVEYGGLFETVGLEIGSVIATQPTAPSVVVTVLLSIIIFLLACGMLITSRWDVLDKKIIGESLIYQRDKSLEKMTLTSKQANAKVAATFDDSSSSRIRPFFGKQNTFSLVQWMRSIFYGKHVKRPKLEMIDDDETYEADADSSLSRFIRVVAKEHTMVSYMVGMSVTKTRLIRFLSAYKSILLSLFFDTVIFGILYPSNNNCYLHQTQSSCLASPSSVTSSGSLCVWDSSKRTCDLAAPENNFAFIVALSIVISIFALPVELFMDYLLYNVCTKRPVLEQFGYNSNAVLGRQVSDIMNGTDGAPAFNPITLVQEVFHLKSTLIAYAEEDPSNNYYKEAMRNIGLYYDSSGRKLFVNFPKALWTRNADNLIRNEISETKLNADRLQKVLNLYDDNDNVEYKKKNANLFRSFIAERLPGNKKQAFNSSFVTQPRDLPEPIRPAPWILAWICYWLLILFFFYWILEWGTVNGDTIVYSWGLNFIGSFFYTALIQELLKLLLLKVIYMALVRSEVDSMYLQLTAPSNTGTILYDGGLIHYLSPACMVARSPTNNHLSSAVLIRGINDVKVHEIIKSQLDQSQREPVHLSASVDGAEVNALMPYRIDPYSVPRQYDRRMKTTGDRLDISARAPEQHELGLLPSSRI